MIGVRSGPEHRAAVDWKLLNPRLGVEFGIEDRALTSAGPPRARSKLRCRAIDLGIDSITRHPGMIMIGHNIACVDWSVAKGGFLCAYQWDGEQELDAGKFVWIG